uniref:Uncharacterized protein n=1 Tax=Tanacetum cinerariifolium TaxID=118510 RepID=A0A699L4F8_TANCI|nr:hypothetical protein [Tanacetum cinerariifolium]GFB20803.1 hypothetical protein [Tanacetum cinerariifolium]
MDQESAQNNTVAKLPLFKQGDYEMCKLRIEQYFQVQDYALWDVIENENSFNSVPIITANADGTSTSKVLGLITAEEKAQKKNDVKAKSMLLMALPNEHLLTFSQYKDAKTLLEAIQARFDVSFASIPVSTVSSPNNTANLSDGTIYAFLANQPNGSQLVHEDLEQIYKDDLEGMDLKWHLALLSIRARRYFQRTGKKITINGSDTAGYDKTKVECFNFHKMRHFVRKCRSPRSQESRPRNQDSSRKTMIMEDISSKAMAAIDRSCFDWSYMGDDEVLTNMALMAFSDSEKEKESNQIKIDNFENASKSLDKLVGSQIADNSKTGLGFTTYNVVAPSPTDLFASPTIDLSSSGLEEFKQPEFESYGPKASMSVCVDTSNVIKKVSDAPIIKD